MPATIPIPAFEATGVLPPMVGSPALSGAQAPYRVSLVEVVRRFSGTEERRAILRGFLAYRAALHGAGAVHGFQWLDGSFAEQIELLEGRPPKDIDVVTFFVPQPGPSTIGQLFNSTSTKSLYRVDAYAVNLQLGQEAVVRRTTYWYGLFSHRRDRQWKGLLEVDLAPDEDAAAMAALDAAEPMP
jgi:hypothetical protein